MSVNVTNKSPSQGVQWGFSSWEKLLNHQEFTWCFCLDLFYSFSVVSLKCAFLWIKAECGVAVNLLLLQRESPLITALRKSAVPWAGTISLHGQSSMAPAVPALLLAVSPEDPWLLRCELCSSETGEKSALSPVTKGQEYCSCSSQMWAYDVTS